ncbi:MAG: DUF2125 domain-containing protein [Rhodospirillales bacterium]|nr:DUF2125 domain-containing protein [Rhodospirillales bacterium]
MPKSRKIAAICLVVLVAGAAYCGWWVVVADRFEQGVDNWIAQQARHGWVLDYTKRTQTGFPGAIDIRLEAPSLVIAGEIRRKWSTDHLSLSLKPWAIDRLLFDAKGDHRWQIGAPGRNPVYQASAQQWHGEIGLTAGVISAVSFEMDEVTVSDPEHRQAWHLAGANVATQLTKNQSPTFNLRFRELEFPQTVDAPLGRRIAHFDARGELTGTLSLAAVPDLLMQWSDSGGTVDFASFDLDYPPLRMRGAGTLALDAALQPVAAFSVKAEGFFAAMDILHGQGLIPLGTSFAAKIALAVLSKTPEGGGPSYLELPLTVQERTFYAGSIALFKLRPVYW